MAGISQFEDLIAWQRARTLTAEVRRIAGSRPLKQDAALAGQLRRAATSVMANISEGFQSRTPAEFNRFLGIAKASAAEAGRTSMLHSMPGSLAKTTSTVSWNSVNQHLNLLAH
jgi:four helix bundle protein